MTTLVLTVGLMASGKTTWAKEWVAEDPNSRARVNRDDLRLLLHGKGFYDNEHTTEDQVTVAAHSTVEALLRSGIDVVCDDTNLNPKTRKEWYKLTRKVGAQIELHEEFLDVPLGTCIHRDILRGREQTPGSFLGSVGHDVIMRAYNRYIKSGLARKPIETDSFVPPKPYNGTPGKRKTVLVDVDGTIADNDGHRGFFDWAKVGKDKPNQEVIDVVMALKHAGYHIIFVSGREDICRDETAEWINRNVYCMWPGVKVMVRDELFMRKAGDGRPDYVIKAEIFDNHIRDNFDVKLCLDDRNQVVDMYRGMGLRVLQVQPGDF